MLALLILTVAIIAIINFLIKKKENNEEMKMTKQEVKEERKIPTYLYLRASAGLNFTFPKMEENGAPIDFFVEAAPLFGKGVKVDANLGARYWF